MTAVSEPETSPFASIEEAIDEIRAGRFVVVVDDEDRENEGDLIMAAEFATPQSIAFFLQHTSGVTNCAAIVRSPSFSRSSSSTTTTKRPARMSSIASSIVAKGVVTAITTG